MPTYRVTKQEIVKWYGTNIRRATALSHNIAGREHLSSLTAGVPPLIFEVVVRDGKGETRHHVTMSRETSERLTSGKHTPERSLDAAFRFLLDREPKESILRRFDIAAISRYFPEFEVNSMLDAFEASLRALQKHRNLVLNQLQHRLSEHSH